MPSFKWEYEARATGYALVAGVDEVGRGALAGPVCAAAVVLPPFVPNSKAVLINDSKILSPSNRERAFVVIMDIAESVGVGSCAPGEIDNLGISAATKCAMRRAISASAFEPHMLLVDAIREIGAEIPYVSIVKGDAQSLSIAAASIVAKVHRDKIMSASCDSEFPEYEFAKHKGYGTPQHLAALRRHGPCAEHRKSYRPISQQHDHRQ